MSAAAMAEQRIGVVIHYWTHIHVAGIHVTDGKLSVGDEVFEVTED